MAAYIAELRSSQIDQSSYSGGSQDTHPLSSPVPDLVDVRLLGESRTYVYSQIKSSVDPFDWFPNSITGRG